MCDSVLSGDERSTIVTKVPAEADVCVVQVLAGIMECNGESNGLILDEVLVLLIYIIDLSK